MKTCKTVSIDESVRDINARELFIHGETVHHLKSEFKMNNRSRMDE